MHVRLASEARRPFSEPEWQHGGGGDTTVVLTLCEACPLADEIGRPQSRMKKMLAMSDEYEQKCTSTRSHLGRVRVLHLGRDGKKRCPLVHRWR